MRCICIWHRQKPAHSGTCARSFLFEGILPALAVRNRVPQNMRPLRHLNLPCTWQHLSNSWEGWCMSITEHWCLLADQAKLILSRWWRNLALWNTLSSDTILSETWTGTKWEMHHCRLTEIQCFGGIKTPLWGQLARLQESARSTCEN